MCKPKGFAHVKYFLLHLPVFRRQLKKPNRCANNFLFIFFYFAILFDFSVLFCFDFSFCIHVLFLFAKMFCGALFHSFFLKKPDKDLFFFEQVFLNCLISVQDVLLARIYHIHYLIGLRALENLTYTIFTAAFGLAAVFLSMLIFLFMIYLFFLNRN